MLKVYRLNCTHRFRFSFPKLPEEFVCPSVPLRYCPQAQQWQIIHHQQRLHPKIIPLLPVMIISIFRSKRLDDCKADCKSACAIHQQHPPVHLPAYLRVERHLRDFSPMSLQHVPQLPRVRAVQPCGTICRSRHEAVARSIKLNVQHLIRVTHFDS